MIEGITRPAEKTMSRVGEAGKQICPLAAWAPRLTEGLSASKCEPVRRDQAGIKKARDLDRGLLSDTRLAPGSSQAYLVEHLFGLPSGSEPKAATVQAMVLPEPTYLLTHLPLRPKATQPVLLAVQVPPRSAHLLKPLG